MPETTRWPRVQAILSALVWPVFVSALFAVLAACAARGHGDLALLVVVPPFMLLLVLLERVLPDRPEPPIWRDPQLPNDVGHALIAQVLAIPLGDLVVALLALLAAQLAAPSTLRLWPAAWPLALQALALVAIADGLAYAGHRALHTLPWLWPIHTLHHAVDRMHVAKANRTHLFDMLIRSATVYAPLVIVGVPPAVLVWYPFATAILGPIAHSNVSVRLPAWLHPLLMTPHVHRLHHARPLALSSSNYANVLPLWDVVFGTFSRPDAHPRFDYGIEPAPYPSGFGAQVLWPLSALRAYAASGRGALRRKRARLSGDQTWSST